ncbi:MAG: polyprenyl synthetase family protein [Candidatus Sumerlaeaceae bacterium]
MNRLSPELEAFFVQAQQDVDDVLRKIITPTGEAIENLDDGTAYALGLDPDAINTGKRIRPLLCLLVCQALSGASRPALPFAAAIELMHNFCLVHDDIEDGDEFRRGRPAVWKRFGLPHGINIGDYLFTKIFQALLLDEFEAPPERTVRMFELMRSTLDHTHRGQALDMNARHQRITTAEYMHLVTEKTGHYLAAPLIAGAIAADATVGQTAALATFGLMIGPMFQIRDDVIDLTHGKGREAIGSDIREGKRSFLVAHTLEHADPAVGAQLLSILNLPRDETTPEHVQEALQLFELCGAMQAADARCGELTKNALAALQVLPDALRSQLWEVTEYLAGRTV